jgi:hypothetical protein
MHKIVLTVCMLVFHFSTFAFVAENTAEGLGLETLMGGIGQARLGSSGALGSNPALLAWLPKKYEFMSTNQISFYKLKAEDGQKLNISPDVIPRFAASSEGFGQWGHSYGLIISKLKIGLNQESEEQRTTGTQETQTINLNYGVGYKISNNTALGLGLYFGRVQEDGDFSAIGESDGFEYAFTIRDRITFWTQGISLGVASKVDTWAFGLSSKFTTATFWATGSQEQSGYSETSSSNSSEVEHKVPYIKIVPNIRGGIQKEFDKMRLFFDLSWIPGYADPDFGDYTKAQLTAGMGIEGSLTEAYNWYSGLSHAPGTGGDGDNGSLNFGLSKKSEHSMNYAGLSWRRAYKSAESELIQINFGTKFDY